MQQIVRQPMLSRSFTIEKLTLNHAKCYGNSFKYRHVSCVGVEDTGSCRNVSYCVLSRTSFIFILMYIMNTNTAQIYTPLLVFLSSFTVTIAPPLCGLRQGSPVGPFTSAPVFQPPHGFLGLFLKFSVKTLLLTYKFFC